MNVCVCVFSMYIHMLAYLSQNRPKEARGSCGRGWGAAKAISRDACSRATARSLCHFGEGYRCGIYIGGRFNPNNYDRLSC